MAAARASARRLAAYASASSGATPCCAVPSVAIQIRIASARGAASASVPPAPKDSSSGWAASTRIRAPLRSVDWYGIRDSSRGMKAQRSLASDRDNSYPGIANSHRRQRKSSGASSTPYVQRRSRAIVSPPRISATECVFRSPTVSFS